MNRWMIGRATNTSRKRQGEGGGRRNEKEGSLGPNRHMQEEGRRGISRQN